MFYLVGRSFWSIVLIGADGGKGVGAVKNLIEFIVKHGNTDP